MVVWEAWVGRLAGKSFYGWNCCVWALGFKLSGLGRSEWGLDGYLVMLLQL